MKFNLLFIAVLTIHVSWAQIGDSIEAHRPHRLGRALAAPAILVSTGLAIKNQDRTIQNWFQRDADDPANPPLSRDYADLAQYAPIALAYGLALTGNGGEHKFWKSTSLLVQSELLMVAIVTPMKHIINEKRPDGGDYSFPSGHTAQAFVAATFLHKEYGHKSIWYSVAGYSMASAVGMCRMVSNRHWASDVLAGAGIGILSTNLVYLMHKHRSRNPRNEITAMPTYNRGPGFYFAMKL